MVVGIVVSAMGAWPAMPGRRLSRNNRESKIGFKCVVFPCAYFICFACPNYTHKKTQAPHVPLYFRTLLLRFVIAWLSWYTPATDAGGAGSDRISGETGGKWVLLFIFVTITCRPEGRWNYITNETSIH